MATDHDWGGPLELGSHHLARGFVDAGWDVARISNPISPVHALRDHGQLRRRAGRFALHGRKDLDGRLWAFMPFALVTPHDRPLLRSGTIHRGWQRTTVPNLVRTVRKQGFAEVDLLYIDTPMQVFWLDEVRSRVSMSRVVDRFDGLSGVAPEMLALERRLLSSVDLVAVVSHVLEAPVQAQGARRVLYLPNGVQFDHFASGSRTPPPDYASIPAPIAIYVGEIGRWFDFNTFQRIATSLPDVSFVLVGPDKLARERIQPRSNVHILGPRPFSELPRYLHNANVGLIPFDIAREPEFVHAIHPLKLYEYLACGLPVVATRWDELVRIASPAILCESPHDFIVGIRTALSGRFERAILVEFARRSDWQGRVETLLGALREIGLHG